MLCDRVLKILEEFSMTKTECAEKLDLNFRTFSRYLKPDGEYNLWQYLPLFLDWFPRLSRQWLYFGEGPMTIGQGVPLDKPVPLPLIVDAIQEMAQDTNGLYADIYRYIADDCRVALEQVATGTESASNESVELATLKEENARLQQDLKEQKEQVVSLLNAQNTLLDTNKLLVERLSNPDGPVGKTAAGTKPAHGAPTSIESSEG